MDSCSKQGFCMVRGGVSEPDPVLFLDLDRVAWLDWRGGEDGARLEVTSDEAVVLAECPGVRVALLTAVDGCAAGRACDEAGFHPVIVSYAAQDGEGEVAALQGLDAPARAAAAFALWCQEQGISRNRVVFAAAHPAALEAMAMSGVALAMEEAGADACRAAEVALGPRSADALRRALACAQALR